MPYGTVNLRYGVPKGETTVTCTAGVGTFLIEFSALSKMTGDPIFEKVAMRAMDSLWEARSAIDLVNISCFIVIKDVFPYATKAYVDYTCRLNAKMISAIV